MTERLFKGRNSIGARLLALALAVIMVLNTMPTSALTANAAVSDKVTDYSTINEWQDYFLNGNTEYAGGVWTDKSVFKSGSDFDRALSANETKTNIVTAPDNFLISMSALATNKEIVGYSTVPTDTMFIIDVSQSMDNSGSIPQTVNAANSAIKRLLELNNNNRVGIILYSGRESGTGSANTNSGTVLLELNRYTAGNGGRYITYSGNSDTTIRTETNLKYESTGQKVSSKSKQTIGGTYIQNGLVIAMNEFLKAKPVVEDGNIQEGVIRMPVFVLMGDGAPTHATTSYTNIGTSNMGTGNSTTTSNGIGFVTQLTAAYTRASVEEHYGRDARFYTLRLNLSESTGHAVATSVLDPEQSSNAINTYWDNLIRNGSTSVTAHTTGGSQSNNFSVSRPSRGNGANRVYTDLLTRESQYYVDEYFPANNNAALEQAFTDIVAEIILQSAYYPTLIEGTERNLSGYVTFRDEIGHHMEVKDVKGILLGDDMFTGEVLAKMMVEGEFGNAQTFNTKGWELVETVSERIGVSEDIAISLLNSAWSDKQLYYENDANYGNYIGWYEGANEEYIAFWSQEDDDADAQAAVANGAKYITKSYGYYGATEGAHSILGSDMMHVVVKVRTEIATGLQEVIFEIPASLIPIITYAITLDSDSYDTANNITMEIGDETPIRLLFEVGLSSEVNERNLTEIMTAEGAHNHPVLDREGNPTGEYYFYTNVWGNTNDPGNLEPSKHEVAESVFTPSTVNERYYHVEDAVLYRKSGNNYVAYTGNAVPSGTGYFIAYRTFNLIGNSKAEIGYIYEEVSPETLAYNNGANLSENDNGEWYIKKGTVRRTIASYHIEKVNDGNQIGGPTNTLMYSRYAQILESGQVEDYMVYSFQGNNGRLKMTPATGIKLTKQVDATITDGDAEFTFNVQLGNNSNATYTLVKNEVESSIEFTNGKSADVKLKAGETAYITGLPGGVTYTVTEQDSEEYKIAGITVNGVEADVASGTVVSQELQNVVFTNTLRKEGNLVITKTVEHDFGDDYAISTDKKFEIEVVFKDADENALANTTLNTSAGEMTTDDNGMISFELAHDESLTIYDLNEGTKYEVNEVEDENKMPKGFSLKSESGTDGEIEADETATASLVNKYEPEVPTANLDIDVTKTLTDMANAEVDWGTREFSFYLEMQDVNNLNSWIAIDNGTTSASKKEVTLTIPKDVLTSARNYLFRVREDASTVGIVNDTDKYFTVVVTDSDMDGHLEISQVIRMNNPVEFENGVAITFNNKYAVEGGLNVQIPVEKELVNNTGVLVRPGGFEFGLYENIADVRSTVVTPIAKGTSNALGEAVINMQYDSAWFNIQDTDNDGVVTKTYYLAELHDAGTIGTGSYDDTIYTVEIVIGLENNQLVRNKLTITSGGEEKPALFTNTYTIDSVDFELNGRKTLTGRNIKDTDRFEVKMYSTGASFVVSEGATAVSTAIVNPNGANGTFSLEDEITTAGTHYYVVEETVGEVKGVTYDTTKYHVTVVTDVDPDNSGKLKVISITRNVVGGGIVNEVTFTNAYKATPVSIAIEGTKVLTAEDIDKNILKSGKDIASGDFTFVLLAADGVTPIKDKDGNDIVAVSGLGITHDGVATSTFHFPEIEYTAAGTYEYVVAERDDNKNGYEYDTTEYTVSVIVTDDEEGTLSAVVSRKVDELEFNNTYTPEETSIPFEAVKLMDGRNLEADEFDFGIYETGSDFNAIGKEPIQVVSNAQNGSISFAPITFKERGTYYFVMKEIVPSSDDATYDSNVVYDPVEYQITVLVWDVDGKLYSRISTAMGGSAVGQLFFSNVYVEPAPVSVELTGTKKLTGRELNRGDFSFELYATDDTFALDEDKILQVVNNGDDQDAAVDVIKFAGIPYKMDDLNGADYKYFYYVIKEVVPEDLAGATYDGSQFRITVKLSDNGARELVTEVAIDDSETANKESDTTFVFENEYEAADAKLVLGGTKTLEGKDLKADDFEFALYKTGSDYAIDGLTAAETVKNKDDGAFEFAEIAYSEVGTYYYAVVEVAGSDSKVTYDDTKHNVKVVVSDNGHGELEIDIEYSNIQLTDKTEAKVENLNFTNGFNPDDTVVTLGGHKTLEGKDLTAKEFEFALYETGKDFDATGKTAAQTKSNDAEGVYGFDSLVFTEKGTYYYVVKEVVPADTKGVTYDTTEHRIKVEVSYDSAEGILSQVVTINGKEYKDAVVKFDELDFTNTYKATLKTGLTIQGQKNLSGDRTEVKEGEFSFTLYEVVTRDGSSEETLIKIGTVENSANGKFIFDVIKDYTQPGTHRYRVIEDVGNAEGMTYDSAVYDITVEIIDDGEGNLVVKTPVYTVNGFAKENIEFNNTYAAPKVEPVAPKTGDSTSVAVWSTLAFASLMVCGALLVIEKKRRNKI